MAGYVIAEVNVTDPEKFEVYRGQVGATIEKYDGKYVVRGGATETVEGDWNPQRLVILKFENVERAKLGLGLLHNIIPTSFVGDVLSKETCPAP